MKNLKNILYGLVLIITVTVFIINMNSCSKKEKFGPTMGGDEAERVYVAPGK